MTDLDPSVSERIGNLVTEVKTFKTQFDAPLRQKSIQQVATELRNGSMQAGQAPRGK